MMPAINLLCVYSGKIQVKGEIKQCLKSCNLMSFIMSNVVIQEKKSCDRFLKLKCPG